MERHVLLKLSSMGELLMESTFVSIDLETTGINMEKSHIIEIACVRVEGGVITESFSTLVYPGEFIPERIKKLTGITNAMLVGKPSFEEVLPRFLRFIGNSVIVGHNVKRDIGFIDKYHRTVYGKPFKHPHVCTLELARKLLPGLKSYRLYDLANYFGIEHSKEHRALSDAQTTALVFLKLLNILWSNFRIGSYLEVKRFSKA